MTSTRSPAPAVITPSAEVLDARRAVIVRAAAALQEARRARNHGRSGLGDDLRCECARPECRATVPAVAEDSRGAAERFIVVPDHGAGEKVVAAADRFFVVEPARRPAGG
ncbi:MAG: hypothetical protein ACXVRJ_14160 [Gaiellaceae bacterium]